MILGDRLSRPEAGREISRRDNNYCSKTTPSQKWILFLKWRSNEIPTFVGSFIFPDAFFFRGHAAAVVAIFHRTAGARVEHFQVEFGSGSGGPGLGIVADIQNATSSQIGVRGMLVRGGGIGRRRRRVGRRASACRSDRRGFCRCLRRRGGSFRAVLLSR